MKEERNIQTNQSKTFNRKAAIIKGKRKTETALDKTGVHFKTRRAGGSSKSKGMSKHDHTPVIQTKDRIGSK